MKNIRITRRSLLKSSAMTGLGLALAGAAPSFTAPKPQPKMAPINIQRQNKALVFIMLDGGNDSYNMLVPTSKQHYRDYKNTRSNLALDKGELLRLKGFQDPEGRRFGLHPSMPEVKDLFLQKQLSFIANIGPMVEPLSKADFYSGKARLPLGLLSHADQFKHWQTSRPDQRINSGWFGYFADALQPNRVASQIPMNISLAGSNIMQNGLSASHYSITDKGSVGLVVNEEDSPLNNELLRSFEDLLTAEYANDPFKSSYLALTREAQAQHGVYRRATEHVRVPGRFSDTPLSQQLKKVAQSIQASKTLNLPQQTFFLRYIGWDHHDEVLDNQARMLRVLSQALGEFQYALEQMGLADRVITFTGSDFGRTLTSNGNGSDHGWGGNTLVMGNAIDGGKVFGQYPDLKLGDSNPLDAGDGVLIPTTATDLLYAELAEWFGVARRDLPRLFPNLARFYDVNSRRPALGVLAS